MPDYLNPFMPSRNKRLLDDAGLFKHVRSFVPPSTKGLKELNVCQKWFRNKSLWTGSQKIKKNVERLRMSRFLLQFLFYLWNLFYFGIKSHKIEHNLKKAWLIKVSLMKMYTNLIFHKSKQVHFPPTRLPLNCGTEEYEISVWSWKYGI